MTELDIARGRKEIMSLLRVEDWGTVRSWYRLHKLPLRRLPNNQPFLIPLEVKRWMVKYSETIIKQQK